MTFFQTHDDNGIKRTYKLSQGFLVPVEVPEKERNNVYHFEGSGRLNVDYKIDGEESIFGHYNLIMLNPQEDSLRSPDFAAIRKRSICLGDRLLGRKVADFLTNVLPLPGEIIAIEANVKTTT